MARRLLLAGMAVVLGPAAYAQDLQVVSADVELVSTALGVANGYAWYGIDVNGATLTRLDGLTPNGLMVGAYRDSAGKLHGLVIGGGVAKSFDIAGATTVFALGINPAGDIVGRYDLPDGSVHGFQFSKGKALEVAYEGAVHGTVPHAISPNGEIVGYYLDQQRNFHGFIAPKHGKPQSTPEPAGAIGSGAFAVNSAGQIGGFYYFADRAWHGFLLTGNDVKTIDMPGATSTTFWGMNPQGHAVGTWYSPGERGFLYRGGDCATDCLPIDVPGAISTRANSIDPQGNIIGYYTDAATKTRGFLMVPVTP